MASNLTVKKADGTTDVTFTVVAGASGDKSPAVYRSNSVGSAAGHHPELRVQSSSNSARTSRKVTCQFSFPTLITSTDSGETTVKNRVNGQFEMILPVEAPDTNIGEAVSQFINLLDHADIVAAIKTGYAPT